MWSSRFSWILHCLINIINNLIISDKSYGKHHEYVHLLLCCKCRTGGMVRKTTQFVYRVRAKVFNCVILQKTVTSAADEIGSFLLLSFIPSSVRFGSCFSLFLQHFLLSSHCLCLVRWTRKEVFKNLLKSISKNHVMHYFK